jgi:hypothetical protein
MRIRAFLSLGLTLAFALPAAAGPRDEALRLAPGDFALTFVVQDFRAHSGAVLESPFAAWFPTSALGKKFFASAPFKAATDAPAPVFAALGVTPSEVFHDILGDAVVFAYAPAAAGRGERSVILVRPRKPELLAEVVGRVNDAQIRSKELKAVVPHKHAGEPYFERRKPEGPSDFYCFRGGAFALSQSEAEVKAVIDRDRTAPKDKQSELAARMARLGVAGAAAVLLVNPRPLDAQIAAKVRDAAPNERAFLTRFAEVWRATEAAAAYLALDAGAEAGVSLRFDPARLPPGAKSWLAGERTPSALWAAIPDGALAAAGGRVKPDDLFDFLGLLNGERKPTPREVIEQALGPIVGKDKLPAVLESLGPDWGAWVMPPAEGMGEAKEKLPVAVAAVRVRAAGEKGDEAAQALLQSLEYGFQAARVAHNARHKAQIALREEKDGEAVITSLSGGAFPAGFRPCFALKGGYLLVSTSPEGIKSFKPPAGEPKPGGGVPLARFNATAARAYLTSHAAPLARLLASAGAGEEEPLANQLAGLAALLEPVDRVELLARGDAAGVKFMLRVKAIKPLKK